MNRKLFARLALVAVVLIVIGAIFEGKEPEEPEEPSFSALDLTSAIVKYVAAKSVQLATVDEDYLIRCNLIPDDTWEFHFVADERKWDIVRIRGTDGGKDVWTLHEETGEIVSSQGC